MTTAGVSQWASQSYPSVCAAIACMLLADGSVSAQSLKTFPPGTQPLNASVGVYLIDLVKIDEATLSFTLSGYLNVEWRDARLGRELPPQLDRDALALDQVWNPNIELMNEYNARVVNNSRLTADAEGLVRYEERFEAQLSTELDLRRFPFDRQTLLMSIESFRYGSDELVLTPRQGHALQSPAAFLPDWYILAARQRADSDRNNPERKEYSRYHFEIDVQRKVGYYVWNVFLPLAFIVLLPWAVFWIDAQDVRTRVSISMTALLTAIALSLVITGSRPRVSYMTFFDAVFLNSYFLIFLSTVSVVAEHFTLRRTSSARIAERTSAVGRVAYPTLLVLSNVLLVLMFLF